MILDGANDWRFVTATAGSEDTLFLGGRAVWKEEWRPVGKDVRLPDPHYANQVHVLSIYENGPLDDPVRFAAGEFSNGIFGFFEPVDR